MASEQGAELKANRRAKKAERKKQKKREKIMHYELRKN
jgi:hypothetical protein